VSYRVSYPFDVSRDFGVVLLMPRDVTIGVPFSKNSLPNCLEDPALCETFIEEQEVLRLAAESGLPEGLSDWRTAFAWDGRRGRFVWDVVSLIFKSEDVDRSVRVRIDAGSGDVIERQVIDIKTMENVQSLVPVNVK